MAKKKNVRAIILAAGESKRLRPLTHDQPKCLLKVNGRCIIDHQINALKNLGITGISLVIGYEGDKLRKHLEINHPDLNFDFIENKKFAETSAAYSLWLAKHHLKNSDVIYLNSDVMFDPKILGLILNNKHESATALQKNDWDKEQVNISIDDSGKIIEIGKHIPANKSHGEFIGVTKIGKAFNKHLVGALEHFVNQGELKKFAAEAINHAIQRRGASKHTVDVTHLKAIEIDTPEDYELANKLWS